MPNGALKAVSQPIMAPYFARLNIKVCKRLNTHCASKECPANAGCAVFHPNNTTALRGDVATKVAQEMTCHKPHSWECAFL